MSGQRAEGKKLIGAQASAELWRGVDDWLSKNPGKTVTDFVLAALLEKLAREGVSVDSVLALRDKRGRMPAVISSASKSPEEKFVDQLEAAADKLLEQEAAEKRSKRLSSPASSLKTKKRTGQ
jgi:hypothetical protein